jgi:hypothetical protein
MRTYDNMADHTGQGLLLIWKGICPRHDKCLHCTCLCMCAPGEGLEEGSVLKSIVTALRLLVTCSY